MDKKIPSWFKKKVFICYACKAKKMKEIKLSTVLSLFGVSHQGVYQALQRENQKKHYLKPVKEIVLHWRRYMPPIGTRELYQIIKPELESKAIKLCRDGLFNYLRKENLLIKPIRSYIKTTNSKHWMRKYPNLLKDYIASKPEEFL